jgi:hypothetical protein
MLRIRNYATKLTFISYCVIWVNAEIDKIQIFDITGKMIQEVNVNESITKIDANLYAPGLYLIQAIKTDGTLLGKTKWQKL